MGKSRNFSRPEGGRNIRDPCPESLRLNQYEARLHYARGPGYFLRALQARKKFRGATIFLCCLRPCHQDTDSLLIVQRINRHFEALCVEFVLQFAHLFGAAVALREAPRCRDPAVCDNAQDRPGYFQSGRWPAGLLYQWNCRE